MNYTKLVFSISEWPDVFGKTLTIDFKRRELELTMNFTTSGKAVSNEPSMVFGSIIVGTLKPSLVSPGQAS